MFLRRDNRFRVQAGIGDAIVSAHLANPGRLAELLVPGSAIQLRPASRPTKRRTAYDLVLIESQNHWVSIDSQLPNLLMARLLECGWFARFTPFSTIRREVALGASRIDFLLTASNRTRWLEVKSVTLVEDGVAGFPDAPTDRGRRHLLELERAVAQGAEAEVMFVVQREDAQSFSPHDATDPAFGETLRRVARNGVQIHALRCHITPEAISPVDEIQVIL
ncbi:MAG: DNA/RNA nuclease SfsA [Anaerolineae bacterium]|nr:DNA/RNA nuclease SfsA [Anaerolineae bacterium]